MPATGTLYYSDPKRGQIFRRNWIFTVVDGPDLNLSASYRQATGVLGASNASILTLTDDTVSRYHAELELSSEGIHLRDLDSTNGTFFNDIAIDERFIRDGERFRLGHTEIQIGAHDESIEHEIKSLVEDRSKLLLDSPKHFIAESEAFLNILATAYLLARSPASILLVGAKGTGKCELARWIHENSKRGSNHIFTLTVPTNASVAATNATLFGVSAAHPKDAGEIVGPGLLERASGGSLFIEHLERLPPSTRSQLRSALQSGMTHRLGESEQRRIDVRLISATTQTNLQQVGLGPQSLTHLASVQLSIPDLSDRTEDLRAFAAQALAKDDRPLAWIGPRFERTLVEKEWPQNLDSLRATLGWLQRHPLDHDPLQQARIADLVEQNKGDVTEVAQRFQVPTHALFQYLARHDINVDFDTQGGPPR